MNELSATTQPSVRRMAHQQTAAQLSKASDEELLCLISNSQLLDQGHGPLSLPQSNAKVFVKLVPMTAVEMRPQNRSSTANFFRLPTYYQYRIGSYGFGVWRELAAHRLANDWVMSGMCDRFPLLHHWRVLPVAKGSYDDKTNSQPWGDCRAIHRRVAAITQATCSAALFLEYFPLTLSQWLREQLLQHPDPVALVTGVEDILTELLSFIGAQGLLHMDVHFDNILTDGSQFYLGDFGLAVSQGFQLGSDEQKFFEKNTKTSISAPHSTVSSTRRSPVTIKRMTGDRLCASCWRRPTLARWRCRLPFALISLTGRRWHWRWEISIAD